MENNKISSLELNYNEMILLFTLLVESLLHGQESRSRNKIVNLLKERITEFEKERMALIDKFAEKDEEGKPRIEGDRFVIPDLKEFNKEFLELVDTFKFIFDILPSNKLDFETVKSIIINTKKDMDYNQGEIYASLCDKLEKI